MTSDILDVAGNPLITKTDSTQQVDTDNPSTMVGFEQTTNPAVSAELITDSEVGDALKVSFTFDEAMDTDTDPSVTFTPNVPASADGTLTGQSGAWLDDFTFEVTATVADDNFDADEVTIDITGAKDAVGNLQTDHTSTVALEIDTQNPTAGTIDIVVSDSAQTEGEAGTHSFTVATNDVDPGTIHVEMRGSEYRALSEIEQSYIETVNSAIGTASVTDADGTTAGTGLTGLLEQAEGLEGAVTEFFDGGAADAYEETKLATSASDIEDVIGTASATVDGVTTAGDGLTGLLEQAEALDDAVTDAEGELETAEDTQVSALQNATTIEFGANVTNLVSLSFVVNEVTYSGTLDPAATTTMATFATDVQALLTTGGLTAENAADAFDALQSITFTTDVVVDEASETLTATMTVGESGTPEFGDGEFASLDTDETNTALIDAESAVVSKQEALEAATKAVTDFFSIGNGSAYSSAEEIDVLIGTASVTDADGTTPGTGLTGLLEQAEGLEGDVSSFRVLASETYGRSYTESADIQSDIDDLTTLLNGDDGDNQADNVTGFFDAHTGISDLADLHSQMVTATVTTSVEVTDSTAHTVDLDQLVGRLGEGRVDIVATQTDAAATS